MATMYKSVLSFPIPGDTNHYPAGQPSIALQSAKKGRKPKWTPTRERVAGRLYVFSDLPTEKIVAVLEDKDEKWKPAEISVIHKVRALLDREPNWLRPKTREQMNERVLGLEEAKAQRKFRRVLANSPAIPSERSNPDNAAGMSAVPLTANPTLSSTIQLGEIIFSPLSLDLFSEIPNFDTLEGETGPRRFSFASDYRYHDMEQPDSKSSDEGSLEETSFPDGYDGWSWLDLASQLQFGGLVPDSRQSSINSSLKRRLSGYSAEYIQKISRIMKAHSVSQSSAPPSVAGLARVSIASQDGTASQASTIRPDALRYTAKEPQSMRLIMSGSFLKLDQYIRQQGICLPGITAHDKGSCWCIQQFLDSSKLWVAKNGLVTQNASTVHPGENLFSVDLKFVDVFGNTALHMLAARDASIEALIEMLSAGLDGNAKNNSGQSFLHLLNKRVIRSLAADQELLLATLTKLDKFNINFSDCDFLGRSFLHRLSYAANDSFNRLLRPQSSKFQAIPARDVAGWDVTHNPLIEWNLQVYCGFCRFYSTLSHGRDVYRDTSHDGNALSSDKIGIDVVINPRPAMDIMARLLQSIPKSNYEIAISDVLLYDNVELTTEERQKLLENARLLKTAAVALDEPTIEDIDGRNGLQCIAEVLLVLKPTISNAATNPRKRPAHDTAAGLSKTSPPTSMQFRSELVWNLINVGVDRNNYDRHGNTVLMAFVTHLSDGEDDRTLQRIFQALIMTGANIHWRNRQGETALHVAVRLGRKVATKILLESDANVHARTAEGKGVMALGETHYFKARENPKLYTSIKACMALCSDFGAVATPTMVQEWVTRSWGLAL